MASARRKTTIEERKEIVEYCITHGNNYKGTAKTYDVSYSQVYDWMRKYRKDGEDGLVDRYDRSIVSYVISARNDNKLVFRPLIRL